MAASLGSLMVFSDNPSVPPRTPRNNEKRARGPGTAAAINEHYDTDSGIDWPARSLSHTHTLSRLLFFLQRTISPIVSFHHRPSCVCIVCVWVWVGDVCVFPLSPLSECSPFSLTPLRPRADFGEECVYAARICD
jgi:hypothetical protein